MVGKVEVRITILSSGDSALLTSVEFETKFAQTWFKVQKRLFWQLDFFCCLMYRNFFNSESREKVINSLFKSQILWLTTMFIEFVPDYKLNEDGPHQLLFHFSFSQNVLKEESERTNSTWLYKLVNIYFEKQILSQVTFNSEWNKSSLLRTLTARIL